MIGAPPAFVLLGKVSELTLARWQFAVTTLFHFVFVPLTLGLAPWLALMQTRWLRNRVFSVDDLRRSMGPASQSKVHPA